jgi:predicted transcriptional regulator
MSTALQTRAKAFVAKPVPSGLDYVLGSIAERIIAQYAEEGRLEVDSEMGELVELAMMEAAPAVDQHEGAARDYMAESAAILDAIYKEI